MKKEYFAPDAEIISFSIEEDLLGEGGADASLTPGHGEDSVGGDNF